MDTRDAIENEIGETDGDDLTFVSHDPQNLVTTTAYHATMPLTPTANQPTDQDILETLNDGQWYSWNN